MAFQMFPVESWPSMRMDSLLLGNPFTTIDVVVGKSHAGKQLGNLQGVPDFAHRAVGPMTMSRPIW